MWHQTYLAWLDVGPRFDVPFMAIAFLLDGFTGISRRLAVALKLEKWGDAILIPAMIVILILFWRVANHIWPAHIWPMGYASPAVMAIRYEALRWADISNWVWDIAIFSAVAVCPLLAKHKGRSFAQWVALGYLGNVGAIAWLLLAPRNERAPAVPLQPVL